MKKIFLISIPLVLILGCGTKDPIEPEPKESWPLKVGNRWEYNYAFEYLLYSDSSTSYDTASYTSEIVESVKLDDVMWYHVEDELIFGQSETYTFYYYLGELETGLWYKSSLIAEPELYLKYPLLTGNIIKLRERYYEVININEVIETPIGQFSCYHLYGSDSTIEGSWQSHYFFSPRIGIVQDYGSSKSEYGENHYNMLLSQVLLQ